MLLRKVNGDVLPFAGITLTRFYGFDLRPRRFGRGHPGKLKIKALEIKG